MAGQEPTLEPHGTKPNGIKHGTRLIPGIALHLGCLPLQVILQIVLEPTLITKGTILSSAAKHETRTQRVLLLHLSIIPVLVLSPALLVLAPLAALRTHGVLDPVVGGLLVQGR